MLPKGNFKTDFLKYNEEEEDKLSDINVANFLQYDIMTKQNQNLHHKINILNIKPVICYLVTNVGRHDLFFQSVLVAIFCVLYLAIEK